MNTMHPEILRMLKKSNPVEYNKIECERIIQKIRRFNLPKLSDSIIQDFKTILETANIKYNLKDIKDWEKFVYLVDAFHYIDSVTDENQILLTYINDFLLEWKYYYELVKENKNLYLIEKATLILKNHLDSFIGRYWKIIEKESNLKARKDIFIVDKDKDIDLSGFEI